ncbi:transcriptional regulator [Streptomyces sp. NPDC091371]|uniref:transcriptional regulator n=1 Tax=Streptomyces sp. NPDC091371 TaxID=3155303 RepID=UPI00341B2086
MEGKEPRVPHGPAAWAELRARLDEALAVAGLTKSMLARRAGLGRTVVSQAFSTSDATPVPSAHTVAALARALGLEPGPLLELRTSARAASPAGPEPAAAPPPPAPEAGRPIREWHPHDLEVHPAVEPAPPLGEPHPGLTVPAMPSYVRRPHDAELAGVVADAAAGNSRMAVLVGSSSTGKTRALWEAVQPLAAQGWRLWHPFDPTRAESAQAELARVRPRTVVWLNEAQHYLGAGQGVGERIAAGLRTLLADQRRGPVLVLGTLWPRYADDYTRPAALGQDPHAQVRALLAGRLVMLPDRFDPPALDAARALAGQGDRQLGLALERTQDGRLAQFLAGAPALLQKYRAASPAARALLCAAVDARRLGVGPHLPYAFLTQAAEDYLTDDEYDTLEDDWYERAFTETGRAVHGDLAPLRRMRPRSAGGPPGDHTSGPVYRLADYIEQHGAHERRALCPPASFWSAAYEHVDDPESLLLLSRAAASRLRLHWSHRLWLRAAELGDTVAMVEVAKAKRRAGDVEGADRLIERAAEAGHDQSAMSLAMSRAAVGDFDRADRLVRLTCDAGEEGPLLHLAHWYAQEGHPARAEDLCAYAARSGSDVARALLDALRRGLTGLDVLEFVTLRCSGPFGGDDLAEVAEERAKAGDLQRADELYRLAADAGHTRALVGMCLLRQSMNDEEGVAEVCCLAVEAGNGQVLYSIARAREEAGDAAQADTLLHQAAEAGSWFARDQWTDRLVQSGSLDAAASFVLSAQESSEWPAYRLALLRAADGSRPGLTALLHQADGPASAATLAALAEILERSGEEADALALYERAAFHGNPKALVVLGERAALNGSLQKAKELYQRAVEAGDDKGMLRLGGVLEASQDRAGAEALYRRASGAEDKNTAALAFVQLARMYEADGDVDGWRALARAVADEDETAAVVHHLALEGQQAGENTEGAVLLLHGAADAGSPEALFGLAALEARGKNRGKDRGALLDRIRAAVDAGRDDALMLDSSSGDFLVDFSHNPWPHGLEPDGTPSAPWNPEPPVERRRVREIVIGSGARDGTTAGRAASIEAMTAAIVAAVVADDDWPGGPLSA